jgi:hypothetical protein
MEGTDERVVFNRFFIPRYSDTWKPANTAMIGASTFSRTFSLKLLAKSPQRVITPCVFKHELLILKVFSSTNSFQPTNDIFFSKMKNEVSAWIKRN